jgi:hypothetical protein
MLEDIRNYWTTLHSGAQFTLRDRIIAGVQLYLTGLNYSLTISFMMLDWVTVARGPYANWTALHLGPSRVTGLNYHLRRSVCRWKLIFVGNSCTYFG